MAEKEKSFEENLNNLQEIVEKLQNGSLSLDDSLKSFEEGIKICKVLEKKLKDAEAKILKVSEEE